MLTRARGVPCPQGETQSPGKTPKGETNPNPNPNPTNQVLMRPQRCTQATEASLLHRSMRAGG